MKRILITILPVVALLAACQPKCDVRRGEDFNFDWKFTLGDEPA